MQRLVHVPVVDRHAMCVARGDPCAQGQHERVVGELAAVRRMDHLGVPVDPAELALDQLGAGVTNDRRQLVAAGPGVGERLTHGHRPVDELAIRGQDADGDALARQLAQREDGLDRGDAAASDEDPQPLVLVAGRSAHSLESTLRAAPRIGESPPCVVDNYVAAAARRVGRRQRR